MYVMEQEIEKQRVAIILNGKKKGKINMSNYDESEGKWRTIRGRRIFIASGESLGQAMAKSGKFKREDIRESRKSLSSSDRNKKTLDEQGNYKSQKTLEKQKNKFEARFGNKTSNNQAEKNRINENANIEGSGKTRVQRNWNKYSEEDRREHRHELIQKKLADYKAKKQSNNHVEKLGNSDVDREIKGRINELQREIESGRNSKERTERLKEELSQYEQKYGKQSNNKVENEYHFAGEELYSDNPHRYDDTIKSAQARKEKFKADENFKKEKHLGWGEYNKDGVPVYDNDIDYKGDFGWANLKT